jgi:hypothetical protein
MAYLGFDPQGSSSSYRNIDDISGSFDGLVTTFPLRVGGVVPGIAPINEQQVLINVGGVPQQPDPSGVNGFRLSAGNIVFSSAPSTGEKFWGVILAGADRASAGVSYPDGSVTAPSITFDAQTTTGLYRNGSNQLAIALNGLNPVTFTTTGLRLNGATSGTVTLAAPAAAGGNTLTLPTSNGSTYQILRNGATPGSLEYGDKLVLDTAKPATGTAIDFTGIPSWVKRVTVAFDKVSRAGGHTLIQLGSGGTPKATGYSSNCVYSAQTNAVLSVASSAGIIVANTNSALAGEGLVTFVNSTGNTWIASMALQWAGWGLVGGGSITLDGTLNIVRLTGDSSTFDAGSINILWE